MKKELSSLLVLFSIIFMIQCNLKEKKQQNSKTYTNPIIDKYLADPCIMFDNGYYYLFATGGAEDGRFIPIYKSENLADWQFVRGAVSKGEKESWNYKHFWAPEVIKIKDKYYLYHTASPEHSPQNSGNHVGLAIADKIYGPYEDYGRVLTHSSIDGHPFFDKDSTMYMLYTIEHGNIDGLKAGQIYIDKMISPLQAEGNPKPLVTHHPWQEGPIIQFRNNKYFLTYSVGNWQNDTYHLRYAIAPSVTGPFIEQPDTLLSSNEKIKGPGHHFMFTNKEGKDWIVYHGWDVKFTARYPRIDRIFFEGDKMSSDGPTFTAQKLNK
jgi:beta-xylosidase